MASVFAPACFPNQLCSNNLEALLKDPLKGNAAVVALVEDFDMIVLALLENVEMGVVGDDDNGMR